MKVDICLDTLLAEERWLAFTQARAVVQQGLSFLAPMDEAGNIGCDSPAQGQRGVPLRKVLRRHPCHPAEKLVRCQVAA